MSTVDHTHIDIGLEGYYVTTMSSAICQEKECRENLLKRILVILKGNIPHNDQSCDHLRGCPLGSQKMKLLSLANAIRGTYYNTSVPNQHKKKIDTIEKIYREIEDAIIPLRFLEIRKKQDPNIMVTERITLPDEIIRRILSYLPVKDLYQVALVNTHANEQVNTILPAKAKAKAMLFPHYNPTAGTPTSFLKTTMIALKTLKNMAPLATKAEKYRNFILNNTDDTLPSNGSPQNNTNDFLEEAQRTFLDHQLLYKKPDPSPQNIISVFSSFIAQRFGKGCQQDISALEATEALLNSTAINVNQTNERGRTALHYSVWNEDKEVTRLLLLRGADPNMIEHEKGLSPADLVCEDVDMLLLLLEYGAKPQNIIQALNDKEVSRAQFSTLLFLAQYTHPNPSFKEEYEEYKTHLFIAIRNFFLDSKAIYNQKISPIDLVEGILALNVNPNIQDGWGRTPLHYAVFIGAIDVAKLLLERGASPWILDNDGCSPLSLAQMTCPAFLEYSQLYGV